MVLAMNRIQPETTYTDAEIQELIQQLSMDDMGIPKFLLESEGETSQEE